VSAALLGLMVSMRSCHPPGSAVVFKRILRSNLAVTMRSAAICAAVLEAHSMCWWGLSVTLLCMPSVFGWLVPVAGSWFPADAVVEYCCCFVCALIND
jgi:hypothetical protein